MKRFICFLCASAWIFVLNAQNFLNEANIPTITSFVNESKLWHCQKWGQAFTALEDRYYHFKGDTIIDGILAKKMYQKFSKESPNGTYLAALYEEGDVVYCCYPNQKYFNVLYNFGAKEGEKIFIDETYYIVDNVEEILVNNETLRVLHLSYTEGDENHPFTWVQGFGGKSSPLNSGPKHPGDYVNFTSCEMDGKVVLKVEDLLNNEGKESPNIPTITSFVNESKLWHCQSFKRWHYEGEKFYFKGDTLIDGILAKRMYVFNVWNDDEKYQAALYEEDDKVYCCHDGQNKFQLLYDFGAKQGEKVLVDGKSYTVEDVENIMVKGEPLRVQHLSFTEADRIYQFIWVQGYGGEMTPLCSGPRLSGNYDNFVYCKSDEEMLLESKDIPIPDKQGSSFPVINWVGAVWSYYEYDYEEYFYFRYKVLDRPEVIDGQTYYPLVKFSTCEYIEGEEEAIYRIRQEGDKVYIRKEDIENDTVYRSMDAIFKEKGNDYLLYDFSLNDGDKYCHYGTQISYPLIVHGVDTIQSADNVLFKKMNFRSDVGEDAWLAGIGSLYDLLEPYTHAEVDCPCSRTLNYFCTADSSIVYRNPRTNVYTGPHDELYNEHDHFKDDDCALNPSKIDEMADVSPFAIQAIGSTVTCTSSTATKLEIYTMDAVKIGETAFANGEAMVKVGKTPTTYLYIVTYPNGRRESGKVAIGN